MFHCHSVRHTPLALLVLAFASQGDVGAQADWAELLLTGDEYHSTDLPADPAGRWWVLHRPAGDLVLEALPVMVTPVRGCGDEGPDRRNGRSVSVPESHDPILLVRGTLDLTAGPVRTAFLDHDGSGEGGHVEMRELATFEHTTC